MKKDREREKTMSKTYRWEGIATAVTSIAHSSQSLGTITYLRREKLLLPSGAIEEVPVISGNGLRGILRDTAADLWWEAANEPKLSLAVQHAIWSGGALAKSNGEPLTGSSLQEVRTACPVIGLFGTAGGGRLIDGCIQVGKLIPICQETKHLLPQHLQAEELPSVWDLTQIEYYNRLPEKRRSQESGEDALSPMRYGLETFIAGTRFAFWISLQWPTEAQAAFFGETLNRFTQQARIGGRSAAGHGELSLELTRPELPDANWRDGIPSGHPELLSILARLD